MVDGPRPEGGLQGRLGEVLHPHLAEVMARRNAAGQALDVATVGGEGGRRRRLGGADVAQPGVEGLQEPSVGPELPGHEASAFVASSSTARP